MKTFKQLRENFLKFMKQGKIDVEVTDPPKKKAPAPQLRAGKKVLKMRKKPDGYKSKSV